MRNPIIALSPRRHQGQHPGLLIQRYLAGPATGSEGDPSERRALLEDTILAGKSASLREIYEAAYRRWDDSFPENELNLSAQLAAQARVIVGLGSENVLESGLRFHHTYGVPLIPGSALKGLAGHYCHETLGCTQADGAVLDERRPFRRPTADEDDAYRSYLRGDAAAKPAVNYFRLLFGSTDDGGVIVFHDAWIVPRSLVGGALFLDVMTPHHPKWQTNAAAPTDFDSPVPVSFLSVAGTFQVRVSWSGPDGTDQQRARGWTTLAMTILKEALSEWGIGGKTSSGYGRLVAASNGEPVATVLEPARAARSPLPLSGSGVEAVLLEEKTKKGGWRAKHEPTELTGPIQNSGEVPGDRKPGDKLTLVVASVNEREIAFRYSSASGESGANVPKGKRKGGHGG
jgi:CRISPR-associated protein Cmr6